MELLKKKYYARYQGCKKRKNDLLLPVAKGRFLFAVQENIYFLAFLVWSFRNPLFF